MRVAGIDGTAGGWVVIVLRDGIFESDRLLRPIESRLDGLADIDVIAVDVPIGFGPRAADREARALMKGAASVVFATPSQDVLQAAYGPGLGVSAQAHALGPRIAHMTGLAAEDPRIYEARPEVSFRAMNDGLPLRNRKKSFDGAMQRRDLLRRHGIEIAELREAAGVPLDDVFDAAAAAWSAWRIARGEAVSLPDPPEHVSGRSVAIWY